MTRRWLPRAIAVAACLPLLGALGSGFQLDDYFQQLCLQGRDHRSPLQVFVFFDGDPAHNRLGMEEGWLPWWAAPGLRHASFRYLSVLTMQLDQWLWPSRPALMHLHSLLWLAALAIAATHLYRSLLGPTWVAGLAALLYALDDAHAVPASYLANRNALVAACFGVLSLVCFARARQERWRAGEWWSALYLALALAAGELAIATAGYLVAYAVCLDRESLARRARSLAPHAAVLVGWVLAYSLGGFGASGSGYYVHPLADPARYAKAVAEHVPVLWMGAWTPVPADLAQAVAPGSAAASHLRLFALATLAVTAALVAPLLRSDPLARFFALGAVLSLAPIAAVGPQNRLLAFVALGALGLVVQLVQRAMTHRAWWLAAAPLLAIHLLLAPLLSLELLRVQERANESLERAVASVPSDAAIAGQDLILVNPPDFVYAAGVIQPAKLLAGQPVARRVRVLAGGESQMEATRIDVNTLRVRLAPSLFPNDFARYFRARELAFTVGERVQLGGFEAEIAGLDTGGDPNEFLFRFDVPLEHESLRWLVWRDRVWVAWRPPAPGASESIPAPQGIWAP